MFVSFRYVSSPHVSLFSQNATRLQSLNREIDDLEHQFGASASPAAESMAASDADYAKRRAAALHVLDKRRAERDTLDKKLEAVSQTDSDSSLLPAMGDVDLVVQFYQELGILPPFPRAQHYSHRDFVNELGGRVPMVAPASLSTEVYIKT
jgi:hypothetical protein